MARREMTVERFADIQRLIGLGQSDRQVARALKVGRTRVAEIRRGEGVDLTVPKVSSLQHNRNPRNENDPTYR